MAFPDGKQSCLECGAVCAMAPDEPNAYALWGILQEVGVLLDDGDHEEAQRYVSRVLHSVDYRHDRRRNG